MNSGLDANGWIIVVEENNVSFQIERRDQQEITLRGLHKRAVIRTESFAKRVKAKGG